MAEFDFNMDEYIIGTEHGSGPRDRRTYIAAVPLFVGSVVKISRDSDQQVIPWTNAGDYATVRGIGVVGKYSGSVNTYSSDSELNGAYKIGANVPIMRQTTMTLITSVNVRAGDLAYNKVDTGVFTNVALNNGLVIGSFLDSAAAGSLVRIQLNYY